MIQGGHQRGEVQLSITFQPADPLLQASFTAASALPSASQPASNPTTAGANPTDHTPAALPSTADRLADNPEAENSVSEAQCEAFHMPDQADLGPLGQSLLALSMTHISPSRLQMAAAAHTGGHSRANVAISTADSASSHTAGQIGQLSAAADTCVGSPEDAASVKRNYYPEEIMDEPSLQETHHHHSTHDLFHRHHHHDGNQAAECDAAATAVVSRHGSHQSPSLAAASTAAQGRDEVDNASYSPHEIFAHQYAVHTSTSGQHEQAYLGVPYPAVPYSAVPYPAVSPQRPSQQNGPHQMPPIQGTSGQGYFHQGSQQQPYIPSFHLLGTTPLHDGQNPRLSQHSLSQDPTALTSPAPLHSQHSSFSSPPHSSPQPAQHQPLQYSHQFGSAPTFPPQQFFAQQSVQHSSLSVSGLPDATHPHTPQHNSFSTQPHPSRQAEQHSNQSVKVPAWRLLGTSPLRDSWAAVQADVATQQHTSSNLNHDRISNPGGTAAEEHMGSMTHPLTYASLAVQSWSTRAGPPEGPHRPFSSGMAQVHDTAYIGPHCFTCLFCRSLERRSLPTAVAS